MSRAGFLILLGVLTALSPFSGLPVALRSLLAVCFGVCVFGIGFSLRTRDVQHARSAASVPEQEPQNGVSPI